MIQSKTTIILLLSFATILMSCANPTENGGSNNQATFEEEQLDEAAIDSTTKIKSKSIAETRNQENSKASGFVENLKTGEKLNTFFKDNWTFVYHEDNRCDGSTDGKMYNLKSTQIDSVIRINVENDGDGWLCDKKEPTTFDLDFHLQEKIKKWDRIEIPNYNNQEENIVYVLGYGESDYLKIHYDDNHLIKKLEYRSEDPG